MNDAASAIPSDDASQLDWLLFQQNQVLSRPQARSFMSESRLRHLVVTGRWSRPTRGIYVAHNAPVTPDQRVWIGALAAGNGRPAPLAGLSALLSYGFRGYPSTLVHVYVPMRMRPRNLPCYVVMHRTERLDRADLQPGSPPRTSPSRAAIDAARWAQSDERARAIIAAAFQQRVVDGRAMMSALARLTRLRRRSLITTTIRDAGEGSESIAELDFLQLCKRGRLPLPARQSVLVDAAGRRRYRDAYFEQWGVHVEIDGGHHIEVREWWSDMRRQNDMGISGERVLRFPAWALRNDPDLVIAQVRAALVAAGWRP